MKFKLFATLGATLLLELSAIAQTEVTIDMAGKKTVTKSGTIKGDNYIDYKLNVPAAGKAGVTLKSNNTANYFNILPPGSSDVAIYNSSMDGNSYSGELSQTGVYTIRVYLMRAAARRNEQGKYTLTVTLSTGSAGGSDAKVG